MGGGFFGSDILRISASSAVRPRFFVAALIATLLSAFGADAQTASSSNPPPIMAIPGKMGVSATGAFTYTIPIIVPPGTNNLVPALSLDYSSQYGDGTVGIGWTLAGLPTITRCPRTLAQDGVHGSVNFDAGSGSDATNDRFCMNGQRLILISGSGYGKAGSQYRTEIESFSEIIAHGTGMNGPVWFEVHSKNGQILQFGHTTDSAIPANGSCSGGTCVTRTWAVNQIADTKGNYLSVTYNNDTSNGQAYPVEIDYTGNSNSPVLAPYNKVTFTYIDRAATDIVPSYQAGSLQQTTVLLSRIQTYTNLATTPTMVMNYALSYLQAGQTNSSGHTATHDELTSIRQCSGSGTCTSGACSGQTYCLPNTTFTWQGSGPKPTVDPESISYGQWAALYGMPTTYPGDFNGDGITDFVVPTPLTSPPMFTCPLQSTYGTSFYIGSGSGTASSYTGTNYNYTGGGGGPFCPLRDQTYPPETPVAFAVLTGDFNGDGLTDIIQETVAAGNFFVPYLSTGNGFQQKATVIGGLPIAEGDFNGDGLADLIYEASSGSPPLPSGPVTFYFSNGDGSFNKVSSSGQTGLYISSGDFDGDGCTDILGATGASQVTIYYSSYFSNCASAAPSSTTNGVNVNLSNPSYSISGDFNGDGKQDFIDNAGKLWFSTGTGLTQTNFVAPSGWALSSARVGDFNGDGKQDIVVQDTMNNDIEVWVSTGQTGCLPGPSCADGSHPAFSKLYSLALPPQPPYIGIAFSVADWNNDGAQDVWIQSTSGGQPELLFEYTPELMTTVTDGLGAKTTAQYNTLSSGGTFYKKDTNATYPTQDMDGPQYFVSETETSTGVGGNYITKYSYEGAKTDLQGRGFLGFTTVTATDTETGLVTQTTYNTVFPGSSLATSHTPAVGAILMQTKTCPTSVAACAAGAVTLQSVTNQWENKNLGGTPGGGGAYYFVGLTQSSVANIDLNGAPLPGTTTTNAYDCDSATPCYGNATVIELEDYNTDGSLSSTKTTTNSYANDATNWLIGRLYYSTVESVLGSSDITRQSRFCYDLTITVPNCTASTGTPSGLLLQQIREPDVGTTNELHLETDYTLDQFGNRTAVAMKGCTYVASNCQTSNGNAHRTTQYIYANNPTGTPPYNAQFPTTITDPLNFSHVLTYDIASGGVTSDTDPNNQTTDWTYDGFGRMTNETLPDGTQTVIAYTYCTGLPTGESCPTNGVASVIATPEDSSGNQNGPIAIVYYDTLARVIAKDVEGFDSSASNCSASAPCWIRVLTTYDALGRVYQTTRPFFLSVHTQETTTFIYDVLARVTNASFPDSSQTNYGFNGVITTVTNDLNETTTTTRNAQGLIASVEDADSQTTNYAYDAFGDLKTVTDPNTDKITNTYDRIGRKLTTSDPDMGVWTYVYDAYSELYSQVDASANLITMQYDKLGHMVERDEAPANTYWTYGITATDHDVEQLIKACIGTATQCSSGSSNYIRTITYDSVARVATADIKTTGTDHAYSITYNAGNGQLGTVTYPSGLVATYDYTPNGYLDEVQNQNGTDLWDVNTRDAELHALSFDEGSSNPVTHSYYATTGRLHTVRAQSGMAASFNYVWDTIGNLTSRTDNVNTYTESFCYDALNRVTSYQLTTSTACPQTGSGRTIVAYDSLGNITSKSDVGTGTGSGVYSYGSGAGPHAVTSITGHNVWPGIDNPTIQYDSNGNQTCIGAGTSCTSPFRTTTYTDFNKPAQVTEGTTTVNYAYDDAHARYHQAEVVGGATTDTTYLNFGAFMEESVIAGGVTTTHDYLSIDGEIVLDYQLTGGAQSRKYYINDELGSVSAILGGAGALLEQDSYDAWGLRRNTDGTPASHACSITSSTATRGFTNQEMIDSICMVNLNARLYDPVIGRIPVPDSVIPDTYDLQSLNRYSYVNNGPLSATDPTGNLSQDWGGSLSDFDAGGPCLNCALSGTAQQIADQLVQHAVAVGLLASSVQVVSASAEGNVITSVTLSGVPGIDPDTGASATYTITSQLGQITGLAEQGQVANAASYDSVSQARGQEANVLTGNPSPTLADVGLRGLTLGGSAGTNGVPIVLAALAPGIGHNGGPPLDPVEEGCAEDPVLCVIPLVAPLMSGPVGHQGPISSDQDRGRAAQNAIRDHLRYDDLNAARLELKGQRFYKANGEAWDHVAEVRNGQNALRNRINRVKTMIGTPGLSVGEQLYYEDELRGLSSYLDYTKGFVP